MDKSLQSAINSYYEIYSDNAEVLSESEVELGQSPTPGGMTPKKPATGSAGPVKKPGNAVPTRKPGQPITSLKDSYEIVLDYLIDEKYADSVDSAEAIMLGMSEQWMYEILDEAKVDSDLSPGEKASVRNKRANLPANDPITRTLLASGRRGKSPKGMKPPKPTESTMSMAKYELSLKHPETSSGKRVDAERRMNRAELGDSNRRGS